MADIRVTGQLDLFVRANADPIDGNWGMTFGAQPMAIKSNSATHSAGQVAGSAYWLTGPYTPSGGGFIEAWGAVTGGGANGLAWSLEMVQQPGVIGTVDGYRWRNEGLTTSTSRFYKITNGATSILATDGSVGFTSGSLYDHMMLFRLYPGSPTTLEGWSSTDGGANWTLIQTTTDSTYSGSFYIGMGVRDNGATQLLGWGNFGGGLPTPTHTQIYRVLRGWGTVQESS